MSEDGTRRRSATSPRSEQRDRTTANAPYQFDPDSRVRLPVLFAGN